MEQKEVNKILCLITDIKLLSDGPVGHESTSRSMQTITESCDELLLDELDMLAGRAGHGVIISDF